MRISSEKERPGRRPIVARALGDGKLAFVRQSSPQIANVFRNDNAVLREKTADLIDEPDAISNQATANPVNRLHRRLFCGLDGDSPLPDLSGEHQAKPVQHRAMGGSSSA
jgi:hypothetical protein